tara:strand:+ start:1371 stop:2234 length:864 start_codon:yes stop_codon:yes gene_type:complete
MSIGRFISKAIPVAIAAATGGPVAAYGTVAAQKAQERQERRTKREISDIRAANAERAKQMAEFRDTDIIFPSSSMTRVPSTSRAGFGATFGEFLGDVGRNIATPFVSLAQTVAPLFGRSVAQQPAVTTTRGAGAQETQGSGSIEAGAGSLLGQGLTAAGRFLRTPTGQIGTGGALGLFGSMLSPSGEKMRITRKMKSQARMVLNLTGGNISAAADILNISEDMLITVLLKRFRNDGPVVTKAALRKTKQTIRRLHNMQDVLKSITPTAAGRRRAPMRRTSTTTLIKN